HDIKSLIDAFAKARSIKGKPYAIVAHTIKGKGVSIFENKGNYHGVAPSDDELKIALQELGEA
ncbi:MAG: transketolase, partial [Candidatus Dadabacteria bacterium]|nr:transketolase [Candidatus Dadabacteria bacterium]